MRSASLALLAARLAHAPVPGAPRALAPRAPDAAPALAPNAVPTLAPGIPLMNHEALSPQAAQPAAAADEPLRSALDGEAKAPSVRLPSDVAPTEVDWRLRVDPESASFGGTVSIRARAARPVDRLVLRSLELAYTRASVNGRPLDLSRLVVDPKAETVTIPLDAPLSGDAVVELEYAGRMNELMRGLFKARWRQDGREEAWAFTHLEPTHARRVLPSFDEPGFKAKYRVTLDVPEALSAISNMPPESVTVADGRRVVAFRQTPPMSSYLLAAYAARLESATREVGETAVSAWAHASQLDQTRFALDAAEHTLRYLNEYFALPYGLPKLDLVVAPDFASGAMENWGAILFRDASLLVDERLSSEAAKRRVAEVVAHEIVHQWFGNLVTMGWWSDLWLNEGFATWMATKVVHAWKPEWRVWDEFDQGKRAPLALDALPGAYAVRSDASSPAEIQAKFDGMSYAKGGALLRMIEAYVGEGAFRDGLRGYMRRFQHANAEAGDLAAELQKAAPNVPVSRALDGWLSRPGAPIVKVSLRRGAAGETLVFEQERFSALGAPAPGRWAIPLRVRARPRGEKVPRIVKLLMEDGRAELPIDAAWAYPNAGETGYYRVALDEALLERALEHAGELEPAERSGLLDNLWAQARAGALPADRFLAALERLRGDGSRLVLEDAAGYLRALARDVASTPGEKEALGALARELLGPAAARLGWERTEGEKQEDSLLRPALLDALASLAPGPELDAEADRRVAAYLRDPGSVDPLTAGVALKAAARRNDPALFEEFRRRLASPATPEQKTLMMRALAEFTDPALVDRYLAVTLSDDLRPQDAWAPYTLLLAKPAARERTWAFLKARWPELYAKVGPRGATRIVAAADGLVVSAALRDDVASFFEDAIRRDPKGELAMARKSLAQALQSIDLGLRFRELQRPALARWAAGR